MWKYIKMLTAFKNVSKAYQEEKGTGKPWWLSRRFFGSVFALVGIVLSAFLGLSLEPDQLEQLANLTTDLAGCIERLVAVGISLYGIVLAIIGAIAKTRNEGEGNETNAAN